ncbi:putative 16S rRNA (cytidine(1402)-2'-O)-methyltransferase [Lupinus albus]|uniref:Putative 16S rRNA (Cytidine(1402)-2'-O)-methyltransferase n=1 Tax=Lupinus albus TaxID=3870 RepID=A0A6A4Q6F1_LUPAL|nr:putative 16S rRNA (cytidine(1402)-2'-O)-methyltransferase [Lupinus albus]
MFGAELEVVGGKMFVRRLGWMPIPLTATVGLRSHVWCIWKKQNHHHHHHHHHHLIFSHSLSRNVSVYSFCSDSNFNQHTLPQQSSKPGNNVLKPGLYLVGTPIGNLEDITFRALKVLKSANVILSEDTRHSGKLLHHYNIKTPLMSYHKFNESQREHVVLKRLKEGEIVALITDAGTPGISDPGMDLAKLCVDEHILVVPIPGPCALVSALSASGLPTDEFTFVGFLPKHSGSRRKRLMVSADQKATQIFYVPPHKLSQFLEESSSIFGDARRCVIAREMTKLHEEFWRGTLSEAKEVFSLRQAKGELTILIEGQADSKVEPPSDIQLENDLKELIASGESLSSAVKLVASRTSMSRKTIYSLALSKFGEQLEEEDNSN